MYTIANQHNDLIDLPLRKFTSSEIDILHAICYRCQNEGAREISLPFSAIEELSQYRGKNKPRLYRDIENMGDKLFSLQFKIGTEREFTKFVLFPTYKVSEEKQTLTVKVNEDFLYLFNELTGNYTSLELRQSSSLKSSYAKQIYKGLRKFKGTGKWVITLVDFRNYLDIPKTYTRSDINKRIVKPSIEELSVYFAGLKCKKQYDKTRRGRGRPSVVGYIFTFTKFSRCNHGNSAGWKRLGKFCPRCHKEVFQREMKNENGKYFLIGHPDFKIGSCDWTTTDFTKALLKVDAKNDNENLSIDEQKKRDDLANKIQEKTRALAKKFEIDR